jgi:hypothetical protein
MPAIHEESRASGPSEGGPIMLLAVVVALALVGSVGWSLIFGV